MTQYAFSKTWHISPNNTLAAQTDAKLTNQTFLLNMVKLLTGGTAYNMNGVAGASAFAWRDTGGNVVASPKVPGTIRYTCNSVAVSTLGVNNLALPTDFVAANAASPHSWWIVDFADIGVEVMFALDATNTNVANLTIIASPYAATGNRFAVGTTTANPATPALAYTIQSVQPHGGCASTNAALVLQMWTSSDGECVKFGVCNGGEMNTILKVEKPKNTDALWTNPNVVYFKGASAATSTVTVALMHTASNYYAYANATAVTLSQSMPYFNGTACVSLQTSPNAISGKWDMYRQTIGKGVAPVQGEHARLHDEWWAPLTLVTGDISAADAPYAEGRVVVVGDQYWPWCGLDFVKA